MGERQTIKERESLEHERTTYDEETIFQLEAVRNSEWATDFYLREILYELRYARRKAERP